MIILHYEKVVDLPFSRNYYMQKRLFFQFLLRKSGKFTIFRNFYLLPI